MMHFHQLISIHRWTKILMIMILCSSIVNSLGETIINSDWTIDSGGVYSNEIYVVNGNVILDSPGKVTFVNVTFDMTGTLIIIQGSHTFINSTIQSSLSKTIDIDTDNNYFDNNIIYGIINSGIFIEQSSGNTFYNNSINHGGLASYGIYMDNAHDNVFINNSISTAGVNGIYLFQSNNNQFTNGSIKGGDFSDSYALFDRSSSGNIFSYNNFSSSSSHAIRVLSSNNTVYNDNIITTDSALSSILLESTRNVDFIGNYINSSTSFLQSTAQIDSDFISNQVSGSETSSITNSYNSQIINNTFLTSNYTSNNILDLSNFDEGTIDHNNLSMGIKFDISENNTISNNFLELQNSTVTLNALDLSNGRFNSFINNTITNFAGGIFLLSETNNTITNNTILSDIGIKLTQTQFTNITRNNIFSDQTLQLMDRSHRNTISGNHMEANYSISSTALVIDNSRLNLIFNNNIVSDGDGVSVRNLWRTGTSIFEKNQLVNNTINANNRGLWVQESHHAVDAFNNSISSIDGVALYLYRVREYNLFQNNNITSHSNHAVETDLAQLVELRDNFISSVINRAMFLSDFQSGKIINNTLISIHETIFSIDSLNTEFINNTIIATDPLGTAIQIFVNPSTLKDRGSTDNLFINNYYEGNLIHIFDFDFTSNLTNLTVGDEIETTLVNPLPDYGGQLKYYRWSNENTIYSTYGSIVVDRLDVDSIEIWTEGTYGDRWLDQTYFNITRESAVPILGAVFNGGFIVDAFPIKELEAHKYYYNFTLSDDTFIREFVISIDDNVFETIIFPYGTKTAFYIFQVDVLPLGIGHFEIFLTDISGNEGFHLFDYEIVDGTAPIISELEDQTIYLSDTDRSISWTVDELHPDRYEIYVNGDLVSDSSLTTVENIIFNMETYDIGNYTLRLVVFDKSDNRAQTLVNVEIRSKLSTGSTAVPLTSTVKPNNKNGINYPISVWLLFPMLTVIVILRKKYNMID